jgi:Flp pilus assembly protein TadD
MKFIKVLFVVLVLPGLAFAAGTDETPAADKPSFGKAINELSRFLSSTNPETKVTETKPEAKTEPKPEIAGGATPVVPEVGLPGITTSSGNISEPKPAPMHLPIADDIDKYEKSVPIVPPMTPAPKNLIIQEPMLTPEAKRIFRKMPSNIGGTNAPGGSVAIQRGKFSVEMHDDESVLNNEGKPAAANKPELKIEMQDAKTTETEISMLEKGLKALMAGQYESAIAIYKTILAKQPLNRDAMFGLATAYHKAGQRTQARQAYSELLTKYPSFQDGLNNFLMLAAEEAPKDALEELEQLAVRNPNYAPIFAQKASIYSRMGNTEKAVDNFIQAILIDPNNSAYKYNLATIYDRAGNREKARKLYAELLEDSYKGKPMPVGRNEISDRLEILSNKASN